MFLWDPPPKNLSVVSECVKKFAPSIPVTRLLGRSGFGNAVGCVEADTSDDTQEITSLGGCLTWNNAYVSCGRVMLIFL